MSRSIHCAHGASKHRCWLVLVVPVLAAAAHADDLDWMVGCWISDDGTSQEVWMRESENALLGFSVTVSDTRVSFYEILTVKRNSRGRWIYTARIPEQEAVAFAARNEEDGRIVFRNASHVYPQQIEYKKDGEALLAVIALLGGFDERSFAKNACQADVTSADGS